MGITWEKIADCLREFVNHKDLALQLQKQEYCKIEEETDTESTLTCIIIIYTIILRIVSINCGREGTCPYIIFLSVLCLAFPLPWCGALLSCLPFALLSCLPFALLWCLVVVPSLCLVVEGERVHVMCTMLALLCSCMCFGGSVI